MKRILVIGAGFAGVWSAAAAARVRHQRGIPATELSITLVAPSDDLVIRPVLYQADPVKARVPLARLLGPLGITHIRAAVTDVDPAGEVVHTVSRDDTRSMTGYDRLILATGSRLIRPNLRGGHHLHDVDTIDTATALQDHLNRLPDGFPVAGRFAAVVVGAGFTGIEVATELIHRLELMANRYQASPARVYLVERAPVIGPDLGSAPRPVIEQAIGDLGILRRLGTTVDSLNDRSLQLTDGEIIPTCTVVWTAGLESSSLTSQIPAQRDHLGRLHVDPYLRVPGLTHLFAAGDTAAPLADAGHPVLQCCQHAIPQGLYAGHNAAADLLGLPLRPFSVGGYVTCLDLGAAGAVFTTGWDRAVHATGFAAKELKRAINASIYPPLDDAAQLLRHADPTWHERDQMTWRSISSEMTG